MNLGIMNTAIQNLSESIQSLNLSLNNIRDNFDFQLDILQ